MLDTFDPAAFSSAAETLSALREHGIALSHRLGARVFGLGRRGVRFSLAFLEEAAAGGPAEEILKDPRWSRLPLRPARPDIEPLLDGREAALVEEGGALHVVTPDEAALAPLGGAVENSPAPGSLLPVVLGAPPAASAVPGSVWDRRRMEEAAMRLLDAEDPAELVSSLRYLFRAVLASGQDPSALLVSVLRRGKLELAREAAALIRDNLNRDLGRALDGLLSGEPSRMRDALHYLLHHAGRNWNEVLRAVTFPALATVLGREDRRSVLFPVLEQLVRLAPAEAERVEPFLDVLVDRLEDLDNHERFALSRFLLGLQEVYPEVAGYLLRRVQQTADPHLRAYYANVLSRLRLEAGQRTAVVDLVVDLVARHGQDVALQERLRVTCMNLGPQALERLSSETSLPGTQRVWLVHLWQACRTAGVELPSEDLFARFAWDELRARNRGALLALIRTGQLRHAGLAQRLAGGGPGAVGVLAYLLDEAYRLEDPDDQPVLDLLAAAGAEVLEPAFALVREEAALESGGAPLRLLLFARLARRAAGPADAPRLREMTAELLSLDFISPRAVPATWVGLGHLAAVPGLGPELGAALLERIAEPLDVWPEARVEGLLAMYPAVEPELQARIEDLLRRVLRAEEPSRPVLRACLAGLERLVARRTPRAVEGLVADLCRSILFRSREESLQRLLNQALSDEAAGDGVRLPAPWDREDRERALQILGLLALRPDLSPRLKRMILVRLFSFLDDWLDVVERGTNLYEARDSALWAVLTSILEAGGGQEVVARAEEACLRVLELHRRVPARLALDRRENVQRFLLAALARCGQVEVRVRGVGLDLRQLILRTVMDLASGGDSQVTRHLLRQTARLGVLPGPLQEELDSFLDRQPP